MLATGVFLLFLFAAGLFLIGFGVYTIVQRFRGKSWPSVTGEITESSVVKGEGTDTDGWPQTSHKLRVAYRYEVGGQAFTGDRISHGSVTSYGQRSDADKELRKYPKGPVDVLYNPQDHGEDALHMDSAGWVFGPILIALGGFVVYLAISASSVVLS